MFFGSDRFELIAAYLGLPYPDLSAKLLREQMAGVEMKIKT